MSLNSFKFIVLFAVFFLVMLAVQLIKKKELVRKIQIVLLLLFSYFFVFTSSWKFCICVAVITVITYVLGLLIEKDKYRTLFFVLGIICLLAFLGYFKYANFFVNSARSLLGEDAIALNIILPVGISFYIFSALSYIIDVYRKTCSAEKNFLNFALYIAFFAKLTAGPIVRPMDFLPQLKDYRGIDAEHFKSGIQIFVFGLFKKMVLADHLAVFVDDVFYSPSAYNTGTVILAAVSYSLQIYFDFSGYSDMAIGISKVLGFDIKPNFNMPYASANFSEFWNRWHISLSTWFRDYVYIPLGGSRKGTIRTYINLLLTMLLSGLWHGAGWTFIVWGALHGVLSCLHNVFKRHNLKGWKYLNICITFTVATLLWVIFRATSFGNAMAVFASMFTIHSGISQPYTWSLLAIVVFIAATIVAKVRSGKDRIEGFYPMMNLNTILGLTVFFVFCGLTIIMGYHGNTFFIYGQF